MNARMYDPKIARFLQEDTYAGDPNDPLSLNLYTYCSNNPIIYYDPTGHFWKEVGEFFKPVVSGAKKTADAIVSFSGSFIARTFDTLVYKPTYTVSKNLGVAETYLFGTSYLDSAAEDYKIDTEITTDYFKSWGSNQTAKDIGELDGSVFGQALQFATLWKVGSISNITKSFTTIDKNIGLNFFAGTTSTYLNKYADGYRGDELMMASVETGTLSAAGGAAIDYIAPKLPSIYNTIFGKKNNFANVPINDTKPLLSEVAEESSQASNLDLIKDLMKKGTKTADGKNIITQLDDNTKVIFRMDVGDYAHPIGSYGYLEPVNHINIEIQTTAMSGNVYKKWDYHMILDDFGEVSDTFTTGPWNNK